MARLHLFFDPAPDDSWVAGGLMQTTFGKFRSFLSLRGVKAYTPMYYDVGADAQGYVGEFVIPLGRTKDSALDIILAAWFEGPLGRRARLRVGEEETTARTPEEADTFLRRARQRREAPLTRESYLPE